MSASRRLVDWSLAERTAGAVIGGIGPLGRPAPAPAPDGYDAVTVAATCADAIDAAAAYAGLGPVAAPPRPELIDRRQWARTALATLAEAARPIEARVFAELELPGPLGPIARSVAGAAAGAEAGVAVGYAARRVLGQYDLALFGRERPGRLLFVTENLSAARRELGADPDLFLRWVALHESTHVVQFERVPWLTTHMRALAAELVSSAAAGLDPGTLAALARRLIGDPRAVVRGILRGEFARLLADPAAVATIDRLQAAMSVIEGHAEHVMDAAGGALGADVAELRRRLDRRRERRGGLGDVIGRLLGVDLKLRQYQRGKAFCDAVVGSGGPEALVAIWRSPDQLPDLAELEHPDRWLQRVSSASSPPGVAA
jgi:coenzyme F420 biosynthesis associated uncharacterized protein